MTARRKIAWIAAGGIPVLFLALTALQRRIDVSTAAIGQQEEELMLRSGKTLARLSFGYQALLADIYWTRVVQYYGSRAGRPDSKFPLLWPLLDITTTLDPKLTPAYRFGTVFLSEPPPVGEGRADKAVELIQRGISENPDDWQMNASLGFLYYWYLKDYKKSSAAYLQGSKNPLAPGWLGMMAAQVAFKADATETSKMIWTEIYNSTPNPLIRKSALQHLEGFQALEDIQLLNQLSEKYRAAFGHYPVSIEALVDAGVLRTVPKDPTGVPYVIGIDGKANVGPKSDVVVEAPPPTPPQ
jgi:hypothetical protein